MDKNKVHHNYNPFSLINDISCSISQSINIRLMNIFCGSRAYDMLWNNTILGQVVSMDYHNFQQNIIMGRNKPRLRKICTLRFWQRLWARFGVWKRAFLKNRSNISVARQASNTTNFLSTQYQHPMPYPKDSSKTTSTKLTFTSSSAFILRNTRPFQEGIIDT